MTQKRVATLAVGTEVTDGQIVDKNSAWISQQVSRLGFTVIEHRAVPDERAMILKALQDLSNQCELLFVTGGLGPTSDDFTRELVSEFCGVSLEFNEKSWQDVSQKLSQRGVPISPSQRQQCYFPKGSQIIANSFGTADAFYVKRGDLEIFALPGPPIEIETVWNSQIGSLLEDRIPAKDREELLIFRCLGKGESELADRTEEVMRGSGLRLGYRAHMPYVEIKVWVPQGEHAKYESFLQRLEETLRPWLVNQGDEDLAETFLDKVRSLDRVVAVVDQATAGLLAERLGVLLRSKKYADSPQLKMVIEPGPRGFLAEKDLKNADNLLSEADFALMAHFEEKFWTLGARTARGVKVEVIKPPYVYTLGSERARKYITERALQFFVDSFS